MAEGGGVPTKGGLSGESSGTLPKSTRFSQQPTQRSTQTLRGDREEEEDSPSDPNDSDMERDLGILKGKQPRAHRRYTLEPGDIADEVLVTEIQDGEEEPQEAIFAKVRTAGEFIDSATAHPEIWCNAIRNMMTGLLAHQETNEGHHRDLIASRERVASLKQQLKESNQQLQAALGNEERLRESRTTYRTRNGKLKEEITELRIEMEDLRARLRTLQDPEGDPSDPDDSDLEGERRRRPTPNRRVTAPSASSGRHSRRDTPAGTNTTSGGKSNNKYPDVKDFKGNHEDRDTWDSWKMHLKSKFMMSWELFETEVSKILYIRDHCKDVAYNIIKAKADLDAIDHYITAEEVITDLEQQFGDIDKEGRADAELQDPKMAMGAKDPKETFDAFHSRFTAVISPLVMSEREKCNHLRRLISVKLKYRVVDYPSSMSYRELVTRLGQVDLNLRIMNQQTPRGERGGGSSSTRGGRGGSNSNPGQTSGAKDSSQRKGRYRHPQHVADRLRKEGRCFKCLQPGHLPNEENAPCKNKDWPTEKQATAMLAETGLEHAPVASDPPPTYNQQLSEN